MSEKEFESRNQKQIDEIWKLFKETDRRIKETDRIVKETALQMKETDRKMQETDRRMKETDKKIDKMIGDWGNNWGNLAESLVKAGLVDRFREIGIMIKFFISNMKAIDQKTEYDLIGFNGNQIVVVEVKAKLREQDIAKFIKKLSDFKEFCPFMRDKKDKEILGAMATFSNNAERDAVKMVIEAGMFFIDISGDIIVKSPSEYVVA